MCSCVCVFWGEMSACLFVLRGGGVSVRDHVSV